MHTRDSFDGYPEPWRYGLEAQHVVSSRWEMHDVGLAAVFVVRSCDMHGQEFGDTHEVVHYSCAVPV